MRNQKPSTYRPIYERTSPADLWRYRREMHERGLGYVEFPHPLGKAFCFVATKHLVETGVDVFLGEELPTYEMRG